jgi:outer membrane protein OmpA-like peptidoglycan-associated protein
MNKTKWIASLLLIATAHTAQAQTTLTNLLTPITQPLGEGLGMITEGLSPVTSPILEPVSGLVNGILTPVTETLSPITIPLSEGLNTALDGITNPIDQVLGMDLLGSLEPVLTGLSPVTNPLLPALDNQLSNLTGGNLTDALFNTDVNNLANGDGLVNDLFGGTTSRLTDLIIGQIANSERLANFEPTKLLEQLPIQKNSDASAPELLNFNAPFTPTQGRTFQMKDVQFDTSRAELTPAAKAWLTNFAQQLKRLPNWKGLVISGHTDDQGSADDNQKLSEARAIAVAKFLMSRGIDKTKLAAFGYGESQPVMPGTSMDARSANRRVEFRML